MIATAAQSKSAATVHPQHGAARDVAEVKLDAIGFENPPGGVQVHEGLKGQQS